MINPKNDKMKKMARLEIGCTSMLFPWEGKKNRMRRDQKWPSFDFPMQMSLGNIVDFQPAVPVFRQPRNAARAIFFEKVEELAGFSRQLPNHS